MSSVAYFDWGITLVTGAVRLEEEQFKSKQKKEKQEEDKRLQQFRQISLSLSPI